MKKLSIVIPAFNEEKNIRSGVLEEVNAYLKSMDFEYEVIIVDDGSTDETVEVAKKEIENKKNFRLIENPHGGKAVTVMSGMLKAEGEIALFTDMDQATPIQELEKLLPKFEEGFEVVIGSRQGRKGAPLIRKLMAFGFATFRNIILGLPFSDTQCGFKAFNKKSRDETFSKMLKEWQKPNNKGLAAVNAGFDVESLFIAKKKDFKIAEVPVNWHHVGSARVQFIRDSIEAIKDVIRIRINDIQGKYS